MLTLVADRLRAVTGPNDLVARLGGDEFVILQRVGGRSRRVRGARPAGVRDPARAGGAARRPGRDRLLDRHRVRPGPRESVPDLLRCADIALYDAKSIRDAAVVYSQQLDRHSAVLLGLQADLRAALENDADDQLWVAFQPQSNLTTGTVDSVECLARWHHPELGEVAPDTFIPIAEGSSLTGLLLHRILDASLRQLAAWDEEGLRLAASVNLSTRQIGDDNLPETVARYLARYSIAPERLVLEVTESRLMSNPTQCARILSRLHVLGVKISIDDFGTGYSSLGYLQRLAVDELKIDKGFIQELAESGDTTIVRSTVDLGHNLGLRVVAEGVEDDRTAERLAEIGCDALQGYLDRTAGRGPRTARRRAPGRAARRRAPACAPRSPSSTVRRLTVPDVAARTPA